MLSGFGDSRLCLYARSDGGDESHPVSSGM